MIAAESAEQRIVSQLFSEGTLTPVGLAAMRREAELMRVRDYEQVATEAAAPVEDRPGYSRSVTVAGAGDGLKRVTVTVHWDSPTGKAVSD